MTALRAFEVAPELDAAFVARWTRCRDVLAGTDGVRAPRLYRALRSDIELRFVELTAVGSTATWETAVADPACAGDGMPAPARAALYAAVREDGDVDSRGGATLITAYDVLQDADAAFLDAWRRAHEARTGQQGYIGARLHRGIGAADPRFLDVARWSSPLMHARALRRPEVERAARRLAFPTRAALYQGVVA